jgi:hypothetical protein
MIPPSPTVKVTSVVLITPEELLPWIVITYAPFETGVVRFTRNLEPLSYWEFWRVEGVKLKVAPVRAGLTACTDKSTLLLKPFRAFTVMVDSVEKPVERAVMLFERDKL